MQCETRRACRFRSRRGLTGPALAGLVLIAAAFTSPAFAAPPGSPTTSAAAGTSSTKSQTNETKAGTRPKTINTGFGKTTMTSPMAPTVSGVTVKEHKGKKIPLNLSFTDEHGRPVKLKKYFQQGRPVILTLNYYTCPMLCPLIFNAVSKSLSHVALQPSKDYEVVTVSFDPADTPSRALQKKKTFAKRIGKSGSANGWHFLTGEQPNIKALTRSVGFGYKWLKSQNKWAHPAVIMLLSPDGKITRYLYGTNYESGVYKSSTVRLSLVSASNGAIGSTADRFLLTCCQFNPKTGSYDWVAMKLMQVMGAVMTILVVAVIGALLIIEYFRRTS